jgi:hypothetical protein
MLQFLLNDFLPHYNLPSLTTSATDTYSWGTLQGSIWSIRPGTTLLSFQLLEALQQHIANICHSNMVAVRIWYGTPICLLEDGSEYLPKLFILSSYEPENSKFYYSS